MQQVYIYIIIYTQYTPRNKSCHYVFSNLLLVLEPMAPKPTSVYQNQNQIRKTIHLLLANAKTQSVRLGF